MDLGGFPEVFWDHLPAGWGGAGLFRAQFVKFLSGSPTGLTTPCEVAAHLARRASTRLLQCAVGGYVQRR
jgi:hypothetical protein